MEIFSCVATLADTKRRIVLYAFLERFEGDAVNLPSSFIPKSISYLSSERADGSIVDAASGTVDKATSLSNLERTGEESYATGEHELSSASDDPQGVVPNSTNDHDCTINVRRTRTNVAEKRKKQRR